MVEFLATRGKFLKPSDHCNVIKCVFTFRITNFFCSFLWHYGPVRSCKPLVLEIDYITHSSVRFLNQTRSEIMHDVSSHQLSIYYQPQWVLTTAWFRLVLWHINHCRLFNVKSSLYIYIKYIGFGLVGFYGISTIVGYLMPNPLYTYILSI